MIISPHSVFVRLPKYCVPTIQKRNKNHRQTGKSPEDDCEDDQRAGELTLWGKTEVVKSFLPGQEKVQRVVTTVFHYLKGAYREKCRFFHCTEPHGETRGNRYKWHWERFYVDVREFFNSENNQSWEWPPQGYGGVTITVVFKMQLVRLLDNLI